MFNRRFAPMLGAASALAALASTVMKAATAPAAHQTPAMDSEQMARIFRSKGPKGHSWNGKRRKLKKFMQDHQRPRRRRK